MIFAGPRQFWKVWGWALFACSPLIHAVESQPVTVVRIESGLRLSVAGQIGGVTVPITVQIDQVALLGDPQFSRQVTEEFCPPGSQVTLRGDGADFPTDAFGIVHALVFRDLDKNPDPTEARNGPLKPGPIRCSLQVQLIHAGWAQSLRDARSVPPELAQQFQSAEREAKARKLGFYSLPGPGLPDPAVHAPVADITTPQLDPARPPSATPNPF